MYFLGWASLAGGEVWNVQRTLTYLRANAPGLDISGCDECSTLPIALGDAPYKNNPVDDDAPWIADDEPDLADFYGFYPMGMAGLYDGTISVNVTQASGDGGFMSTPRHATKEIRVHGLLMARTRIALVKGRAWLAGSLGGSGCSGALGCHGDSMCFFADCPQDATQGDYYLRTLRDVGLTEGPAIIKTYGQLNSGIWMDEIDFTLTAATPWIYGPIEHLGSTMGTEETTQPANPLTLVGSTHGPLAQRENVVTFPEDSAVGDLLVLTWASDYQRVQLLPGDWQILTEDYEPYYSGGAAWKVANDSDIATRTLTLGLGGVGGGDWAMAAYKAGTFHSDFAQAAARAAACAPPVSGRKIETLVDQFDRIADDAVAEPGYDDVVLADGPISYWKMSEDSGPTVADSLGVVPLTFGDVTGVLRGEPAIAPGLGKSLRVSDGNHGTLAGAAPSPLRPPFTWEAWVSPNTIGYPSAGFVNNWPGWFVIELIDSTYEGRYDQFVVQMAEVLRAEPSETPETTDTPEQQATAIVNLSPKITTVDTVQHLVVVVDATHVTLYQNGVLLDSVAHGLSAVLFWSESARPRFLLGNAEWNDTFRGRASNWAMYDKALSAAQVANHWTMGNTAPPPVPPPPSQIDPAKWVVPNGDVKWQNGRMALTSTAIAATTSVSTLSSAQVYDLNDSAVYAQVVPLPVVPGYGETWLGVASPNSSLALTMAVANRSSMYIAAYNDAGYADGLVVPYDPVADAWLRVRKSGTTVFAESSPDGMTWRARRIFTNMTSPNWAHVFARFLTVLTPDANGPALTAYVDNVNVVPSPPLRIVEHILKHTVTGTLPQTMARFTTTPGAITNYFASRDTSATHETMTCSAGLKEWATSWTGTNAGFNTNSALYSEYNPVPAARAPIWSATPTGVVTQDGAYYLTHEVLPQASPTLAVDETPPQLQDCPYSPPPVLWDPTVPQPPAPPRPPAVTSGLEPPLPWLSGYSIFIPGEYVPEVLDAALVITLTTGADAARWVRLRLYAAPLGFDQKVNDLDPCSYCGEVVVTYIPPNSKFIIDGMNQTLSIVDTAGNVYSASHLAFSGAGLPVQWPTVTCAMDYWLTVEYPGTDDPYNMFIIGGSSWRPGQPNTVSDSATFTVNLGSWTNGFYDGSPRATLTRDTSQFQVAPASMRVNWPSGSTDHPQVVLPGLVPGTTYELGCWVKSPTVRVRLDLDGEGVQAAPSPNWVHISIYVVANAETMIAHLSRDTSAASGDIWVDQFSLRDVSTTQFSVVKVAITTARRE